MALGATSCLDGARAIPLLNDDDDGKLLDCTFCCSTTGLTTATSLTTAFFAFSILSSAIWFCNSLINKFSSSIFFCLILSISASSFEAFILSTLSSAAARRFISSLILVSTAVELTDLVACEESPFLSTLSFVSSLSESKALGVKLWVYWFDKLLTREVVFVAGIENFFSTTSISSSSWTFELIESIFVLLSLIADWPTTLVLVTIISSGSVTWFILSVKFFATNCLLTFSTV